MQAPSLSNDTALLPALLSGNGRLPARALSPEGVAPLLRLLRENKFPLLALTAKADAPQTLAAPLPTRVVPLGMELLTSWW